MAQNSNYTEYSEAKNNPDAKLNHVKHYGSSAFLAKKTEEASETLKKFPVPEKYCK
jgi:hypothetical protein